MHRSPQSVGKRPPATADKRRQVAGFTLVEMLVGMLLGLLVLGGLAVLVNRSSSSFRDLQLDSIRIDNGRYAMDLLSEELNHGGFYGHYHAMGKFTGANLPNPCSLSLDDLRASLDLSIQAYNGASTDPTPGSCLSGGDYRSNTDVLVVRRASTALTSPRDLRASANVGRVYMQTGGIGASYVLNKATSECATNKSRFNLTTPAPDYAAGDTLPESMDCFDYNASLELRAFETHVFYISDCDDCADPPDGVPTLKRISLDLSSGAPAFGNPESLVRGVENMQVYFSLDTDDDGDPDSSAPLAPSAIGSGTPPDLEEWSNLVTADLYLLVRGESESPDYTDGKTYVLGPDDQNDAVTPGGHYKRHAYRIQVRLNNPSDRRL